MRLSLIVRKFINKVFKCINVKYLVFHSLRVELLNLTSYTYFFRLIKY